MKNRRALILLFIANIISGAAQGISMIAVPWYFATIESMQWFAYAYIAVNIVSLFWVPYAGSLVDRYDRKRVFLVVNLATGFLMISIASIGYFYGALHWTFIAAAFCLTFLNYNIHYTALYALVQEISEQKYYSRISSYLEIQGQFTAIIAGVLAIFLIEGTTDGWVRIFGFSFNLGINVKAWPIYQIFGIDAASYFISFLFILAMRYTSLIPKKIDTKSLLTRLSGGLKFLKENTAIFWFGILSYIVFLTVSLEGFYLGALYVNNHLEANADVYATNEMTYSLGALIAGFIIRKLFKSINIPLSILIMMSITALQFAILAHTKSEYILYFMAFLLGLMNAGTRIQRVTYLFRTIPNDLFGRSTSIFKILNILFRILFLGIFSLSYFLKDNHVIYSYDILTLSLIFAIILMIRKYKSFNLTIKP